MMSSSAGPVPPTEKDIFRYRYQHGTNLGAIFVLEKWLKGSMYEKGAEGSSELAAIKSSLKASGLEATRAKWEKHWRTALTDEDFQWLKNVAHCNCIRLPIGYFTLGPAFCKGTAFDGEPAKVYVNAWSIAKELIERCHHEGIGILVDVHCLPGGANGDAHSGTDNGKAELWKSSKNLSRAKDCISFLLQDIARHGMPGVIGLQVCNEAQWNASGMYQWYDDVLAIASSVDPSLPIYISDAWNLTACLDYAAKKNRVDTRTPVNPVIIDTHKYYTFTESDRSKSPQEIISRIPKELEELRNRQGSISDHKTAVAVYVGEYSCVLDGRTWNRVDPSQRPELTKTFGNAQTEVWTSKASGSAFWTFKMDWMDGGDWGFKEQVKKGAIPPPRWTTIPQAEVLAKVKEAEAQRSYFRNHSLAEHTRFWDSSAPGVHFEHWRYAYGWDLGFSDAMNFFCARAHGVIPGEGDGGDMIGARELWLKKRMLETNQFGLNFGWIWEAGFRRGARDFYRFMGV
ncbi:CAZyme family GH5 [Paecilomyces variotii]|nr:CAZyme family GH5 [Paecilomyces variotii]